MSRVIEETFDAAVVGAGHAGCEAALSCAEYYITTLSSTKVQPTLPQLLKAYLAAVPLEEEQREEALTLLQKSKD